MTGIRGLFKTVGAFFQTFRGICRVQSDFTYWSTEDRNDFPTGGNYEQSSVNQMLSTTEGTCRKKEVQFGFPFCFGTEVWDDVYLDEIHCLNKTRRNEKRNILIFDEYIDGGLTVPQPWIPSSLVDIDSYVKIKRQTDGNPSIFHISFHLKNLESVITDFGYEELKVLITTRRQDTKLASSYAQLSDRIKGASQENFEKWVRYITRHPLGYRVGGGAKLDYFKYWKAISDTLGRHNVLLLPFELLKEDSQEFLQNWLDYIGASEKERILKSTLGKNYTLRNSRSASRSTWDLRGPIRRGPRIPPPVGRVLTALGLPVKIPLRWPDFSREQQISLTRRVSDQVLDVYRDSNQSMDECLTHFDLEQYGYY